MASPLTCVITHHQSLHTHARTHTHTHAHTHTHLEPCPHLQQSLLKGRYNGAIVSGPNIQQQIPTQHTFTHSHTPIILHTVILCSVNSEDCCVCVYPLQLTEVTSCSSSRRVSQNESIPSCNTTQCTYLSNNTLLNTHTSVLHTIHNVYRMD